MTPSNWIQAAKALLFDITQCGVKLRKSNLDKEAQELIELAGGYDPYIESASTPLIWPSPGFVFSLGELDDPNTVGELLRNWAFVDKVGCYSCFDLIDGFEKVYEDSYDFDNLLDFFSSNLEEKEKIKSRIHAYYNFERDVLIAWYWDGDGELYFNASGIKIYNKDCKKDYTWTFV